MSIGRSDVQRLFGHFGLDPNDYVSSFARPSPSSAAGPMATVGPRAADQDVRGATERDLFDYRNFELSR